MERTFEHLSLSRAAGVLTCTISNPPSHTLNAQGVSELYQLVEDVTADPTVRVLVFTGADPDIFIAHYEVGELSVSSDRAVAQADQAAAERQSLHPLNQVCLRLEAMDSLRGIKIEQRLRIARFLDSLAEDSGQSGGFSEQDETQREIEIKVIGQYAITCWADHAVNEVKITDVRRADRP